MNRRDYLAFCLLSPSLMSLSPSVSAAASSKTFSFSKDKNEFLLNGNPIQIRSGEMHPSRIPRPYWLQRIQMAKAMGLNTIAIYIMWNYHEVEEGKFDFHSESRDWVHFIKLCQQEGMYVIFRPGPYVCGEWDCGGIPFWYFKDQDEVVRQNSQRSPKYNAGVRRYVQQVAPLVKPLLLQNGGPVLMVQIENEFGSYSDDLKHLEELKSYWVSAGIEGPFYTQDGMAQLFKNKTSIPNGAIGLSGGSYKEIMETRSKYPNVPVMIGELYPGWLTHWGDSDFKGMDVDLRVILDELMQHKASFNFYVLHGGTNFGLTAGANIDKGQYQPDITSYDYGSPITERGAATIKFTAYRNIIAKHLGVTLPPIPKEIRTAKLGHKGSVKPKLFANLMDQWQHFKTLEKLIPIEQLGWNQGIMLYRNKLNTTGKTQLKFDKVHDQAWIFVDREFQYGVSNTLIPAAFKSRDNQHPIKEWSDVNVSASSNKLNIVVEAMGHINFAKEMCEPKGLLGTVDVRTDNGPAKALDGWEVAHASLDTAFLKRVKASAKKPAKKNERLSFYQFDLDVQTPGDVYIDMSKWSKGYVWVNGINLGRYWEIGPQHRLYCPGCWLKPGRNEVIIFDFNVTEAQDVSFSNELSDKPSYFKA